MKFYVGQKVSVEGYGDGFFVHWYDVDGRYIGVRPVGWEAGVAQVPADKVKAEPAHERSLARIRQGEEAERKRRKG